MSDATILLRDVAGDAAQKAADRVNPSQDQLSQIDHPAEDNTWHDVPDMSRGNIKSQAQGMYNKNKPFSRNDMMDAAGDATQSANPNNSRDPASSADMMARDQQYGTDSGIDGRQGAQTGIQSLRDRANENMPQETQDRVRGMADNTKARTKGYLSEKLPQERRQQTIYRLKKMIVEIQGHQDCKIIRQYYMRLINMGLDLQAVETLLSLAEEYGGHGKNLSQQGAGTVKGAHSDTALTQAETDLRVCYRFCQRK